MSHILFLVFRGKFDAGFGKLVKKLGVLPLEFEVFFATEVGNVLIEGVDTVVVNVGDEVGVVVSLFFLHLFVVFFAGELDVELLEESFHGESLLYGILCVNRSFHTELFVSGFRDLSLQFRRSIVFKRYAAGRAALGSEVIANILVEIVFIALEPFVLGHLLYGRSFKDRFVCKSLAEFGIEIFFVSLDGGIAIFFIGSVDGLLGDEVVGPFGSRSGGFDLEGVVNFLTHVVCILIICAFRNGQSNGKFLIEVSTLEVGKKVCQSEERSKSSGGLAEVELSSLGSIGDRGEEFSKSSLLCSGRGSFRRSGSSGGGNGCGFGRRSSGGFGSLGDNGNLYAVELVGNGVGNLNLVTGGNVDSCDRFDFDFVSNGYVLKASPARTAGRGCRPLLVWRLSVRGRRRIPP